MTMKKFITVLMAVVITFAGCGSSATPASSSVSSSETIIDKEEPTAEEEQAGQEPEPEQTYADVYPDNIYYEAIESAFAKGLLEGFAKDDNFRPDDYLINADMALLFYNMAGRPELSDELMEMEIANLDEANEEQAIAIRWCHEAFAGYGFTKDGGEEKFLEPQKNVRAVDFSNMIFLSTEQFDGESPFTEGYSEYYNPEEIPYNHSEDMSRAMAIVVVDKLTDAFPVGTEFTQEIPSEILAQFNPPEPEPVVVAQQPVQQQTAPAPTPTPAPAEPAPAPAADMNNVQWVRDQIAGHANACGFDCSQPAGNSIYLSAYDLNRQWTILSFSYVGNDTWSLAALQDIFTTSGVVYASSTNEITSFISNHAY